MKQTCRNDWCKATFEISEEDLAFLDRLSPKIAEKKEPLPPPLLCPDCRIMRRLAQVNREWGRYFPPSLSPFGYNESLAHEYVPLSEQEARAQGFYWRNVVEKKPEVPKTILASRLPDRTEDIPDDVVQWAIVCERTKRPFRILKQELDFYRRRKLPLPHLHPDERYDRRLALRNPRRLWSRNCMKCRKEMQTTYAPERPEIVYCEGCYLKEVY